MTLGVKKKFVASIVAALLLSLSLLGCSSDEFSCCDPGTRHVNGSYDFQHTITVGPLLVGYPDDFYVWKDDSAASRHMNGEIYTSHESILYNDDFSKTILVEECVGLSLEDVEVMIQRAANENPEGLGSTDFLNQPMGLSIASLRISV